MPDWDLAAFSHIMLALFFSYQETPEEPGGDSGGASPPAGGQAGAEHPRLACVHPPWVQPAALHGLRRGCAAPAAPSPPW